MSSILIKLAQDWFKKFDVKFEKLWTYSSLEKFSEIFEEALCNSKFKIKRKNISKIKIDYVAIYGNRFISFIYHNFVPLGDMNEKANRLKLIANITKKRLKIILRFTIIPVLDIGPDIEEVPLITQGLFEKASEKELAKRKLSEIDWYLQDNL